MSKDITATDTSKNIKSSEAAKALIGNAGEGVKVGGLAVGKAGKVTGLFIGKLSCRFGRACREFSKTLVEKEQK